MLEKSETADNVRVETYFMKTDENLKDDILNCRLVCCNWNIAVETCYERLLMIGNTKFISDINLKSGFLKPYAWNMQRFCFYFQPTRANQFIDAFQNSHSVVQQKNPFLGRLVHFEITLDPVNEEVEFVFAVEKILRLFGHSILFVFLIITSKRSSISAYDYLKVREYMTCLPNLRYLYIRLNTFKARNLSAEFINRHPLPRLKYLTVLEVCDLNGPVLEEIVDKNKHVIYFGMHTQSSLKQQLCEDITNLEGVAVEYEGQSNVPITNCVGSRKNLKLLQMQQRYAEFDMSLNFQYLKTNFAEFLLDLTLELLFPVNQQKLHAECQNLRLELPNLRRLAIQFSGLHSLDFMVLLKSLEVFELLLVSKQHVENYAMYQRLIASEQVIQFVGFEEKMYDSNIWGILEKLKKVKVYFGEKSRCYDYTRLV